MRIVIDMESDGLLDTITKIHCVCYYDIDTQEAVALTDYMDIIRLLSQDNLTIIGHNIMRFDVPAFQKILGLQVNCRKIDTLALSWYLYPKREDHNLYKWGNDLGVVKPQIDDWLNLEEEDYINRCTEDVKINSKLFFLQLEYLFKMYNNDVVAVDRIMGYLTWKLECAAEQEQVKWRLDVLRVIDNLEVLLREREEKFNILREVMPPAIKYAVRMKPKKFTTKDGSVSALGKKWLRLLHEHHLPEYHNSGVTVEVKRDKGNPGSHDQLKEWLFSMGWIPETFRYVREDYNKPLRSIPQISLLDGSDICDSIKKLYEVKPELQQLESFFVIKHRIGILEAFLDHRDKDNFLQAGIAGFANTLRFQHVAPLTNLPTVSKGYGSYVRECLIAPSPKHILCGADMSALEDSTKQHYMYYYDPGFVAEMQEEGFDPHLDVGLQGKMLAEDDIEFYKWYEKRRDLDNLNGQRLTEEENRRYKNIKKTRGDAKKVNFSAVYGVGVTKLSLTTGWHRDKTQKMLNVYWKRNWAVKKVSQNCMVKTVNGQMWLFNPVSRFWYSLRFEKDKFSTLNQGTGVYCFDTWVRKVRNKGICICGQFHDEVVFPLLPKHREEVRAKLQAAIEETNNELKLNVKLRISVAYGNSYADIH